MMLKIVSEAPQYSSTLDPHFKTLLELCLTKDPSQRPSSLDLLNLPFVKPWILQFYEQLSHKDRFQANVLKKHIKKSLPEYFPEIEESQ